jgi:hypothetical protein
MNLIHWLLRTVARRASSPGRAELQASQRYGQGPHLARWSGHGGSAAQFIQERAGGPSVAVSQTGPAPAAANSGRQTMTMPRMPPRTIQLCIHCRQNPARFWVSRSSAQTVRRP